MKLKVCKGFYNQDEMRSGHVVVATLWDVCTLGFKSFSNPTLLLYCYMSAIIFESNCMMPEIDLKCIHLTAVLRGTKLHFTY